MPQAGNQNLNSLFWHRIMEFNYIKTELKHERNDLNNYDAIKRLNHLYFHLFLCIRITCGRHCWARDCCSCV